jgi:farnesyl diphosphate synthase
MTVSTHHLKTWATTGSAAFERQLDAWLTFEPGTGDNRLLAAMRHGVLAGGKRLRPYLVLESARLFGLAGEGPERIAAALEFIHCYSLIHDDLPAMDDDDIRRGRPTVHRAFDEATAILAGDALLTLAFGLLADPATSPSAEVRLSLIAALVAAAGAGGMVGGQMLDLAAEGRFDGGIARPLTAERIIELQGKKTGALIVYGATAGARLQPACGGEALAALTRYGEALGLAFQIRDDLIDVEVDAATAGKATGKDTAAGKGTFVTLLGLEGARARLDAATAEGLAALIRFGQTADPLREVLEFNRTRLS